VVKSELVSMINQKFPGLNETDVALAMDCILGQMTDAITRGERIEIRGLWQF
jgi:nucleoid DNA-binding protein